MKLKEVLEGLDFTSNLDEEELFKINIEDISYNSRNCRENILFVAIKGESVDGHKFVEDAYKRGSRVFIVEKDLDIEEDAIRIVVEDSRLALSKISANFFRNPSKDMTVIGVTGTKGKTTISNYIREIFNMDKREMGIIGTNGVFYKDIEEEIHNTTPESYEIHRILRDMKNVGVDNVVMEVSSSGLMMHRVEDIDFDLGIFTNISRDHIGAKEHEDFEDYLSCKSKLFKLVKYGLVNGDDKYADYIIKSTDKEIETFGIEGEVNFKAENLKAYRDRDFLGVNFDYIDKNKNEDNFTIGAPGVFSVYNGLAIISACRHFNINTDIIKKGLENIKVTGRVEAINAIDDAMVILDYAHNKTSLENILETLEDYKENRLVCLIGSIGGRAKERRKEIGEVVSSRCDLVVLTSDNPDFEDPKVIIDEIHENFVKDTPVIKEVDRQKAVKLAIDNLQRGDILLLAGKGHETSQLINGEYIPYSEKLAVNKAIKSSESNT